MRKDVRQLTSYERVKNMVKEVLFYFFTDSSKYFKKTCSNLFVTPVSPKDTALPNAKAVEFKDLERAFSNFNKDWKNLNKKIQSVVTQNRTHNFWIFDAKEQKKIRDLTQKKIELCKNFIKAPLKLNIEYKDGKDTRNTIRNQFQQDIHNIYQKYQDAINHYATIEEKISVYNKEKKIVPDTRNLSILKSKVSELQENIEQSLLSDIEKITQEGMKLLSGAKKNRITM